MIDASDSGGSPESVERIRGSSLRALVVAFAVIRVGGTLALATWFIYYAQARIVGEALIPWIIAMLGLGLFFAQMATFQVATLVEISRKGVDVKRRGPLLGSHTRHFQWTDFRKLSSINRIGGTVFLITDAAFASPIVTFTRARAILRNPACPIRDVPKFLR